MHRKLVTYEMTSARKTDAYELKGAQKTDAYKMTGAEKTREYELKGAQKTDAYEPKGAQNVRVDQSENHAYKPRKCKIRAYKTVHVSECGRMMELKSFTTIREIVRVKMLT